MIRVAEPVVGDDDGRRRIVRVRTPRIARNRARGEEERPALAEGSVAADEVHGGQGLIRPIFVTDPLGVGRVGLRHDLGAPRERLLRPLLDVDLQRFQLHLVGRDDGLRPARRVEVELPLYAIGRVSDQSFRRDDVLLSLRDADLRLE
jgi:hypothetical protein